MKYLITGGSGFIGTCLIEELIANGHGIINYDIRQSERFPKLTRLADVRDAQTLSDAARGVDGIVHLAAEHHDDVRPVQLYYNVNVRGARNVATAAKNNGIDKITFTSTVALYGLNVGIPTEDSPINPFNDYGQSKHEAEIVFREWADANPRRQLVIVRPSVVFGENNRGNVYNLLKQINSGRFMMIGNGQNQKSLAYVRNLCNFLASSLEVGSGSHIFNYADKPDLTMAEFVESIYAALGGKQPVKLPYFFGLTVGYIFDFLAALTGRRYPISAVRIQKFCADTRIATHNMEALGLMQKYSLDDGLRRTIDHEFGVSTQQANMRHSTIDYPQSYS